MRSQISAEALSVGNIAEMLSYYSSIKLPILSLLVSDCNFNVGFKKAPTNVGLICGKPEEENH